MTLELTKSDGTVLTLDVVKYHIIEYGCYAQIVVMPTSTSLPLLTYDLGPYAACRPSLYISVDEVL
jgi:hypothetical protein